MRPRTLASIVTLITLLLASFGGALAQTPPPTLVPVVLTIVTGADGTNDSPAITLKDIANNPIVMVTLDQPGDLAPGTTNTYNFSVPAPFCDVTQFELVKAAPGGADDPLQISSLTLSIDGAQVYFNSSYPSPLTSSNFTGGSWQATHAYRDRCGALAWTLVEVTVVTGDNGTSDNLNFEINGAFSGAPYTEILNQDSDLQPGMTNTYVFIVPMEFCEMTAFRLLKPQLGAADDDWNLREIYISIDGTEVFFDRDAGVFSPVTATSYPPNGNWSGTEAYTSRCSGGITPILPDVEIIIPEDVRVAPPLQAPGGAPISNIMLPPGQFQPFSGGAFPITAATGACPGFLPSRLVIGGQGRVLQGNTLNVRDQPSTQGNRLTQIPSGATFAVVGGPQCGENIAWWQINYNGISGWAAEGQGSNYWAEPL